MPRDPEPGQEPGSDHNVRLARYEQIKNDFARIKEIDDEVKTLGEERARIVKGLEKDQGVNRGALAGVKKLDKLSAAGVRAHEVSRAELFDLIIKPKLDEAIEGEDKE